MSDAELTDCTRVFSNGTEYMWFLETQCGRCARYRNGQCRVYRAMEMARWDETAFPYKDLMDYKECAGKKCRRFATEMTRHRRQVKGQIGMGGYG